MKHKRTLTTGHAGQDVYIQVVARRWVPTAYGISLMKERRLYLNDSTLVTELGAPLTDAEIFALHDMWFAAVLDYCDQVKAATGWLPQQTAHWDLTPAQRTVYKSKYMREEIVNGNSVWMENPPPSPKRRVKSDNVFRVYVGDASLRDINPNPSDGAMLSVNVGAYRSVSARISVFNLNGESLGQVWQGTIESGKSTLSIPIAALALANGSYSLILDKDDGSRLDARYFQIVR